jgi:hypothetical protein
LRQVPWRTHAPNMPTLTTRPIHMAALTCTAAATNGLQAPDMELLFRPTLPIAIGAGTV